MSPALKQFSDNFTWVFSGIDVLLIVGIIGCENTHLAPKIITVDNKQTAFVCSTECRDAQIASTSAYNSSTGQTSYGGGNSVQRDTEIQVGNLVYESSQIHKEVQVGKDYPVNIETDRHGVAKKLDLIVGEKKYTYRITGTREVSQK